MEPGSTEKRSARRVGFICDVECEGTDTRRVHARISDLSVNGAFVDSITNYPVGSTVKLRFQVGSTNILVDSEVRYCLPQIGMGVRFLHLQAADKDAIESLIKGDGG